MAWVGAQDDAVERVIQSVKRIEEDKECGRENDGPRDSAKARESSFVLTGLGGIGKSVACCKMAVGLLLPDLGWRGVLEQSNFDKNRRSKSGGCRKVMAARKSVLVAAAAIAKALSQSASELGAAGSPARKGVFVEHCKSNWQVTKRAWLNLHPHSPGVPYPKSSIYAYALCTTLMHAVLAQELLTRHLAERDSVERIVVLCGGSGAEVIGLDLAVSELPQYHNRRIHVDIVDLNADWNIVTKWLVQGASRTLNGDFHRANLLTEDGASLAASLASQADVVLLLYGLTELHDIDRVACLRCLSQVKAALPRSARFLIADPLKTCYGKDVWLERELEQHGSSGDKQCDLKVTMVEADVCESALGPWITEASLQMNEDIKVSVHVWSTLIEPAFKPSKRDDGKGNAQNFVVIAVPRLDCVEYLQGWLSNAGQGHLDIFTLGTLSAAHDEDGRRSALWHLESALSSSLCAKCGAVAIVTFVQLSLIPRAPKLLEMFLRTRLAIVDNAESFLSYSKASRIESMAASINLVFGQYAPRVSVCKDPTLLQLALKMQPPNSHVVGIGEPLELAPGSAGFIDQLADFLKRIAGVQLSICNNKEGCSGYLNEDCAAFVTLDRRKPQSLVLHSNQIHTYVRNLTESCAPFNEHVRDAIFLSSSSTKRCKTETETNTRLLPARRNDELVQLLTSRLPFLKVESLRVHLHLT